MIGQFIGRYRIVEKLGSGGMGVVYRAEDTKLEREVALKFLAPHLLSDDEGRQRFEREAKAAAALDHPNICPVYEIDDAEGRSFIAMRLVEGESLDQRIARGPLKLVDALRIGEQTAQGLKAAHEKGVVHRDIKPQNIMIGADNRVTIMDFGLAHLADRSRITKADTSLGTVAYMSPEQAEGRQVDHRADIWALGCVLYEMVAGERPFLGEFDQAVLYSVLNEQPEPLTAIRTDVPVALELLIDKCLAKQPDERYQSAAELAVDLRALSGKLASGSRVLTSRPRTAAAVAEPAPEPRGRTWLPWALVACLALVAAAAWLAPRAQVEPATPQVYRFSIQPPEGAVIKSFELSPDGSALAFVAEEENTVRLWLRRFAESAASPIRGTEGADPLGAPFWSPDSRFIAYFANQKLMKVGLAGQPPIEIADAQLGRGGSWSPSGKILFTPMNHGGQARVFEVDSNGGEPVRVTDENPANSHRSAFFLPGGQKFLFHARHSLVDMDIMLGALGSEETRPLLKAETHGVFVPRKSGSSAGYVLRVRDGVLLAHPFDAAAEEITGGEIPIELEVGADLQMSRGLFSVSGHALAFASQNIPWPQRQLVWVDRQGREIRAVGSIDGYAAVRLSPDESRVALVVVYPTRNQALEIMDLSSGNRFEPVPAYFPTGAMPWSVDGSRVIGARAGPGVTGAYWISVSGEDSPQRVSYRPGARIWDRSPDGLWNLFVEDQSKLVAVAASEGGEPPIVVGEGQTQLRFPRFSPDGALVAYTSSVSGRPEVYIRSFPQAGSPRMVSTAGGDRPVWRGDGRELYYMSAERQVVAVTITTDGSGGVRIGPPEPLFPLRVPEGNENRFFPFDAAADGQRFLITRTLDETIPTPVQVVVNWDVELERIAAERQPAGSR